VIDQRDDVDSRRTRLRNATPNGDTGISSQGRESCEGKSVHSSREKLKGRKHRGPGHHEGGETSIKSEADSHPRSRRSKVHGNRGCNEMDDKPARKAHVSRRRRSPQSSSSQRELLKRERKVHKHVSGRWDTY